MIKINQTQSEEEVLEWLNEKKKNLDKDVVKFVEETHRKLTKYEEKANERLRTLQEVNKK